MGDRAHDEVDLDTVSKFLNSLIERERNKQRSTAADASAARNENNSKNNNDAPKPTDEDWHGMDPTMSMFLHMDTYAAPTEDSPMDNHSWMKAAFENDDAMVRYQCDKLDTTSQPESTMLESLGIPPWPEVPPPAATESDRSPEARVAAADVDVLCHKLREKLDSLQEVEKALDGYCAEMSLRVKELAEQLTRLHEVVSDNAKRMQEWATKIHSTLEKVSPEP